MPCPECLNDCNSLNQCLKFKDFNDVVAQAKKVAALKKFIKSTVPFFRGKQSWLVRDPSVLEYKKLKLSDLTANDYNYRFMTLTFDPKKFSANELSDPRKLHCYMLNALLEVQYLFAKNIILIREYHKSGIPHYHLNYTPKDTDCLEHLKVRMRYYLCNNLYNKYGIHDRIFNNGGIEYLKKANDYYYSFMDMNDYSVPHGINGSSSDSEEEIYDKFIPKENNFYEFLKDI